MKRFNPESVHEPTSYSHGVEVPAGARVVHISGQVGVTPEGRLPPDFVGQAEQAFRNLAAVLREAHLGLEDLVKVNTYLTRHEDLDAYRTVRSRVFGHLRPASTLLVVTALAREGGLIEIEAVAAKA